MAETVPTEVEELLTGEPTVGHLATSTDGRPHVAPLWYRYEDGTVEIMTTGRKLANLRENPRVALSIQKDEDGIPEWRVTLQGTATVIDDEAVTRERNRKLNRKYGIEEDAWESNTLVRIDVGNANSESF